jgi:hypothetical protein
MLVLIAKKNCELLGSAKCTTAFNNLRQALLMVTVLTFPQRARPYIVDTDTSQVDEDEVECIIVFIVIG